jgi:hypothetical protein
MKKCVEIENNLPLYLDDLLSGEEKQAVEEHLNSCTRCSRALVELSETQLVVSNLAEVEPPPWFKQKIMARVREEAEKKSFAQKWFYPLRIKIPVQILATVCIAVLAVYIYRAGEEQMKAVMLSSSPAPVMEVSQNQKPVQSREAPENLTENVAKEKAAAGKDMRDEKAVVQDMSSGFAAPKAEEMKKGQSRENVSVGGLDAAKSIKENVVPDIKADKYASAPAAKSVEQSGAGLERKKASVVSISAMKESRTPRSQSVMPKANIALHVADIDAAAVDAEKLLNKYGSKNIVRQMPEGKVILTAEIKIQNMKDMITKLKTIGQIEERILPAGDSDGNIILVIEILNN